MVRRVRKTQVKANYLMRLKKTLLQVKAQRLTLTFRLHTRKKEKRLFIPKKLPLEDIIHDLLDAEKTVRMMGLSLKLLVKKPVSSWTLSQQI
jgi:hypothetical protein